ncbi:MAG: tRNA preQ1(34) S-adenosylmethionine ribosyltransferase-isomerase QueA [Rhodobacteraceae bacterium]|nr:tRNA preQ1(34) S-adenosylmethionine ribosyltransferase-isomerase QueA [Paracoccaceae bacterium]
MKLSDFDFDLPEDLIATRPARPRSSSRLLVATETRLEDRIFSDLPHLLRPGDRLVLNDTKVIPARLFGQRLRRSDQGETRAGVEITLLSPDGTGNWRAMAKPGKRLKPGETVEFGAGLEARIVAKPEGEVLLAFNLTGEAFDGALAEVGKMPLPPYIAALRQVDSRDNEDYQTVFARHKGAVAAPTASLHFDEALLARLQRQGVDICHVTLHVGAGTFLPVKVDDVSQHRMHAEWGQVSQSAADEINQTRKKGGRIIPVGTTALRLIETAVDDDGTLHAYQDETRIFITPGHRFRVADGLITNFHLPKSTLMMLVSALMGQKRIREIYDHAINQHYRFFSYGDSSLLLPKAR